MDNEDKRELDRIEKKLAELKIELKESMALIAEQMRRLTDATMQVSRVEIQQVQHSEGLNRAFTKVEGLEVKLNELDRTVAAWVNRGSGAWWIAGGVLSAAFGIGIYLFDKAGNELLSMRRELDGLKTVIEFMNKELPDRKGSSASLFRQSSDEPPKPIIPLPMPPPDPPGPIVCKGLSGC